MLIGILSVIAIATSIADQAPMSGSDKITVRNYYLPESTDFV